MDIGSLHAGESALLRAWQLGDTTDLAESADRTIRAAFIERVLVDTGESRPSGIRAVRLAGAVIDGALDLRGARVEYPLALENCEFTSSLMLQEARLLNLSLRGSQVPGLDLEGIEIDGSLWMDHLVSTAEVMLRGAHIGGSLHLRNAKLINEQGKRIALNASRIRVSGAVFCTDAEVHGQIRLISARIDGTLSLRGVKLSLPDKTSLQAERVEVGESIYLDKSFEAEGRVLLNNARVGLSIHSVGARLTRPDLSAGSTSLRANRVTVGRNITCTEGFSVDGAVDIVSAAISGELSFEGMTNGGRSHSLNLSGTTAEIINLNFGDSSYTELNLRNAHTTVLVDSVDSWPATIALDGFTYTRLQPVGPVSPQKRINWLRRAKDGYAPQPYEQLIAAYRGVGLEEDARRVALAKQRERRRTLGVPGRIWGWFLDVTVGYGFRTWLAGVWLCLLTAIGTFAFARDLPESVMNKPPAFEPVVYTLDLLLPIIDFGQQSAWRFSGTLQWIAWLLVVAGWLLTTSVVAGITRVLNRN